MNQAAYLRSGRVLHQAREAYARSLNVMDESDVCIALCAAAFEGFLNEVAFLLRNRLMFPHHTGSAQEVALHEVLVEAEEARMQPVAKYRMGMFALTGKFALKGDIVIKRLATVFRLRNSLLHVKPDVIFEVDRKAGEFKRPKWPPEVDLLVAERVLVAPRDYSETWRTLVSTPPVAAWAYKHVVVAIHSLIAAAPVGSVLRKRLDMGWRSLPNEVTGDAT